MEPQASTNPKNRFSFTFKKPTRETSKTAVVVLLIIVIGVGGYLLVTNNSGKNGSYSYKYKDLTSYSLPGAAKGAGISLQKPVELTASGSPTPKQTQATLTHTVSKNSQQPVTLAQIFLATVNTGTKLQAGYKKNINTMITDPKNVSHEAVVKPIKDYATQRLKTGMVTTFSEAQPFSTANIRTNAWLLTFTATPKDAKDKTTQPDIKGEVIMAVGKTTFYYVMVYSLGNNWQSNQKVWLQVFNSLKLDQ